MEYRDTLPGPFSIVAPIPNGRISRLTVEHCPSCPTCGLASLVDALTYFATKIHRSLSDVQSSPFPYDLVAMVSMEDSNGLPMRAWMP